MMEMAVPIDTGFAVEIHAEWTMPRGRQNQWLRTWLERIDAKLVDGMTHSQAAVHVATDDPLLRDRVRVEGRLRRGVCTPQEATAELVQAFKRHGLSEAEAEREAAFTTMLVGNTVGDFNSDKNSAHQFLSLFR